MSGDLGLRSSIPASISAIKETPNLHVCLVGDADAIRSAISSYRYDKNRLSVLHADSVVSMNDKPTDALRNKKDSSMAVALELLRSGKADAVVSAGNTGALVAMACLSIGRLPGIKRPAICAPLPTKTGHCFVLDLGANIESGALELYQFALMGSALAEVLDGNSRARLGLLNIGSESVKGTQSIKDAGVQIQADNKLNYIGFVEGDEIFTGDVDVVVCDGFVGNVALKVCEGTASFISDRLAAQFRRNLYGLLLAVLAKPLLNRFMRDIDPDRYNGAALLGLNGVVVKSHGGSGVSSFRSAIRHAQHSSAGNLPARIQQLLSQ